MLSDIQFEQAVAAFVTFFVVIDAVGVAPDQGVLRLSFTHYTSPEEVQHLIAALDAELR